MTGAKQKSTSKADSKDLSSFFHYLGEERSGNLKYICSDMWKPYLKVIERKASQAINILDRFHIVAKLNKAIDEVRADEYRKLLKAGCTFMLKYTRWVLLKRPENLTEKVSPLRLAYLMIHFIN
ncbi:MAG: transposase [Planctomycetota bacterium]